MQEDIDKILSSSVTKDIYIILDVDRTIINGTSWFKSCITPDLLIEGKNVQKFITLNEEAYDKKSISLDFFRHETLKLIKQEYDQKYISIIKKKLNINLDSFKGQPVDRRLLYFAGKVSVDEMIVYQECIDYIKILYSIHKNNLKIIYLSSGYQWYIQGVVDGIMEHFLPNFPNYQVIGSKLLIKGGKTSEVFFNSQSVKQKIVEQIINNGLKVSLIADDSPENLELFSCVERNGGKALMIDYKRKQISSEVWKEELAQIRKEHLINYYMTENVKTKIRDVKIDNSFICFLERNMNKIGIFSMSKVEYEKAIKSLCSGFSDKLTSQFIEILENLFFRKGDRVYLRGELYYYWLPTYIFLNNESLSEKYSRLVHETISAFLIVSENISLEKIQDEYNSRAIILSIFEHLQHSILTILNMTEKAEIDMKIKIQGESILYNLIQGITNVIFKTIEGKDLSNDLEEISGQLDFVTFISFFEKCFNYHQGMRELDNIVSIYKSIKLIIDNEKEPPFDYIISFPYGGIGLGYSFVAYMLAKEIPMAFPNIINCHYSSKKGYRRGENAEVPDINSFIPDFYYNRFQELEKGGRCILLYDNNSTTLKTLKEAKKFFGGRNNTVQGAVVGFNYRNLVDCILKRENYEEMAENWEEILDYGVVEEYITAFNTWGTNEKAKILEELFSSPNTDISHLINNNNNYEVRTGKIFKLCRVHNVFDYKTAIKNGVNMIGLHAVYQNFEKYRQNEKLYLPITTISHMKDINIPISDYEVDSISDLLDNIDVEVKVALILEEKMNLEQIRRCLSSYNLNTETTIFQLQHRVDNEYIDCLRKHFQCDIICTIGLNQKDFSEYFEFLNRVLNKNDKILIDLSKHQPDFIHGAEVESVEDSKLKLLNSLIPVLRGSRIPLMFAEDTSVEQMKRYLNLLNKNGVKFAGIDMQNSVEIDSTEQRYQSVLINGKSYQMRVRKSPQKMERWKDFAYKEL